MVPGCGGQQNVVERGRIRLGRKWNGIAPLKVVVRLSVPNKNEPALTLGEKDSLRHVPTPFEQSACYDPRSQKQMQTEQPLRNITVLQGLLPKF